MASNIFSIEQNWVCDRYGATFSPPLDDSTLGISLNVKTSIIPINGLRHPPERHTNGWYIWGGDIFPDDDGFSALHYFHIAAWNSIVAKFLALPPGWRFLTDGVYEDVWFDEALLDIG